MEISHTLLDVADSVRSYLESQHTLTLATASRDAVPHAATLLYVTDETALYFWVASEGTTARYIGENPLVSFTIDEPAADWDDARGLQGRGEAQAVDTGDVDRIVGLFARKYALDATERPEDVSFFRIVPSQLHLIDSEPTSKRQAGVGVRYHRSRVLDVFSHLPPKRAEAIEAKLETIQVNAGSLVVRQGTAAEKFFIVVDGEVEVVREQDGEERQVAFLGPGQFFGEVAILRNTARTASVRAVSPTTLLVMDRATFKNLVAQSLGTTDNWDELIKGRLDQLEDAAN